MSTKRINGQHFETMVRAGLANLRQWENDVNGLNVFPVADGDTGTNMCLTLENGIKYAESQNDLGGYLKMLSQGMLFGARGNSGVILSQFFKGMHQELARCGIVNARELRDALMRGYRAAYTSMVQPVEGTILTVVREGVERIRAQIDRNTTLEHILTLYIAEMKQSLARTPELLPVLKEAGVVDSGGMGFILIVEGMLKGLCGEAIPVKTAVPVVEEPVSKPVSLDHFNENSVFEKGYCMEFILQLMCGGDYVQRFRVSSFVEDLKMYGDSIAVVQEERRVKVHIHTKKPAKIITLAQEYGEFLTFKLDNMQLQHNEQMSKMAVGKKRKKLAVIAVANGEGLKTLFEELGCDCVIDGGSTMNTSAQEFIDAFAQVNAETVLVLPNHKNTILAAEQAVALFRNENIQILPTRSFAEGYYALAMDVADSEDTDYRIAQMRTGFQNIATLAATTASRDFSYHEISCRAGEEIALVNGELVCVSDHWLSTIVEGLRKVDRIEEKESCVIFRGCDVEEERQWDLEDRLMAEFPNLEITLLDGGQAIYHWVIGIV